ncbi:MAG: GNAT family N-acetyltransferase [Candidatus Helarchaeota archaeon]
MEKVKLNLKFRTFHEGDQRGMIMTFNAAFCKSRFCDPMNTERWHWRYGSQRPNYAPDGYQICEFRGKVVGIIMATLRTMKFKGMQYRVAGIDDVSTCPILEKKGIARQLLENAIDFMKKKHVDLSILVADPKGHAQKLYTRLGYTHKTYFSMAMKVVSIRNTLVDFPILTPLAVPLRLYGNWKSRRTQSMFKKYLRTIKFEVLRATQGSFREKLNDAYRLFFSFDDYTKEYWDWYYLARPKSRPSVIIAAKENDEIIAGGVITKQLLQIFNPKKLVPFCVLNEFFVADAYRRRGIGKLLLAQLERAAKHLGCPLIILQFHGRNSAFRALLMKMGYLIVNKADVQMIKPISVRAKKLFQKIKGKKFLWKVPYEQMGF